MPLPASVLHVWVATDYRVRLSAGGFASIRCGSPLPPPLLTLLAHPGDPWGFITAWNPGGKPLPLAVNRRRQRELRDALRASRQEYFAGIGVGPGGWREPGLFVPDMGYAQIDAMAHRFGQFGVVRGAGAGPAELHALV